MKLTDDFYRPEAFYCELEALLKRHHVEIKVSPSVVGPILSVVGPSWSAGVVGSGLNPATVAKLKEVTPMLIDERELP